MVLVKFVKYSRKQSLSPAELSNKVGVWPGENFWKETISTCF